MRRFFFTPQSRNEKTGPMPNIYTDNKSCPERCPFKDGNGCYAEYWRTLAAWNKVSLSLSELAEKVKNETYKGQIIRHNVAGDIALDGTSTVDVNLVKTLSDIYRGRKAYTYTHCQVDDNLIDAVHYARKAGFTINVSCETKAEVKNAKQHGLNAVLVVTEQPKQKRWTEDGITYIRCKNETDGMMCIQCQACTKNRKTVPVFTVHGSGFKKAAKAIMLKQI